MTWPRAAGEHSELRRRNGAAQRLLGGEARGIGLGVGREVQQAPSGALAPKPHLARARC